MVKLSSHVLHISSIALTFYVFFGQSTSFHLLIISFLSWILRITFFLIVLSIVIMGLYLAARVNLFHNYEGLLVSLSQAGLGLKPLHVQEFMGFTTSYS